MEFGVFAACSGSAAFSFPVGLGNKLAGSSHIVLSIFLLHNAVPATSAVDIRAECCFY